MQYGRFKLADTSPTSCQLIGEQVEKELETLGYEVELPTNADWGYVFRLIENRKKFDISVVRLENNEFGLAIEPVKSLLGNLFNKKENAKVIIDWLDDILAINVVVQYIKWYTAEEWKQEFSSDFWKSTI